MSFFFFFEPLTLIFQGNKNYYRHLKSLAVLLKIEIRYVPSVDLLSRPNECIINSIKHIKLFTQTCPEVNPHMVCPTHLLRHRNICLTSIIFLVHVSGLNTILSNFRMYLSYYTFKGLCFYRAYSSRYNTLRNIILRYRIKK